ncbi:MAG: TonB-dependent receptor, partial [Acidobacteriota bacterium]
DGLHGAARYGGVVGGVAYRIWSQWAGHGESLADPDTGADDAWDSQTHGARLDWTRDGDVVMFQGAATLASLHGLFPSPTGPVPAVKPLLRDGEQTREYSALGRWTHRRPGGSSLQLQSSIDFRRNYDLVNPRQLTTDIDAQYHVTAGSRHDLVAGAGYRFLDERVDEGFVFTIIPGHVREKVWSAFAQDQIALGGRVQLSLGTKVEHDTYAGWGVQPTARLMWALVPRRQQLWAAVSRALRTPSLSDVAGRYNYTSFIGQGELPVVIGALGSGAFESEEVVDTEAGYRLEIGGAASLDVTAFRAQYDRLKTSEPLAPRLELTPAPAHLLIPVQFGNLLEATTTGVEIAMHVTPLGWWRLDGGVATFHLTPHAAASSGDAAAAVFDGNAPHVQWQARSGFLVGPRVGLDAMLFYTGALRALGVGAYTRADVNLDVPTTRRTTLSLVGQNLLDTRHAEYGGIGALVRPTLIPRSVRVQLAWRF